MLFHADWFRGMVERVNVASCLALHRELFFQHSAGQSDPKSQNSRERRRRAQQILVGSRRRKVFPISVFVDLVSNQLFSAITLRVPAFDPRQCHS